MCDINKPFACEYNGCYAVFAKKSKLLIHERVHTGDKPFICTEINCNKRYTSNSHLKRHVLTRHSNETKTYECEKCFVVIKNLTNFKRHQNRLHGSNNKRSLTCNECNETFYKKHQLVEHAYTHTGIAPYQCDKCSIHFTNRNMFRKHASNHKEYKCEHCNNIFYRWSLLLYHKRNEHKKDHICKKCNKTFINEQNLKEHNKLHENMKTVFICPENDCQREYQYKRNLKQHLLRYHKNETFVCTECNQTLQTKQKLNEHIDSQHRNRHCEMKSTVKRKQRKDIGTIKTSEIIKLSGLSKTLPYKLEKQIVDNQQINIESVFEIVNKNNNKNVIETC